VIVILGAGYAGRVIYMHATAKGVSALVTSRTPEAHLDFAAPSHRLPFDLEREVTWRNIPLGCDLIWCFPATPLKAVSSFADAVLRKAGRIVVLGSTSAYETSTSNSDSMLDESAPIDRTRPRVMGEDYLRTHAGATVLRVAGIYGPGRNVLAWIRRGKVGLSQRYVNLVHVEDLAAICLSALEKGHAGEIYNVSDGQPRRWSEICEVARIRWGVVPVKSDSDQQAGKRLSIAKLTRDLHYRFQHPDLYAALDAIERATSSRPPGAPTE
jgi:nucleoside-diphosphate-sugar epimerase